jgi:hypothetical protein
MFEYQVVTIVVGGNAVRVIAKIGLSGELSDIRPF